MRVRGYVSTVLGCPYQGEVPLADVVRVARALHEMGCYEISLGDTIGVGTPAQGTRDAAGGRAAKCRCPRWPCTSTTPTARRWPTSSPASRKACAVVDSAVSGAGGCPYAKGASGNVASEDVVYMLHGLGIETGIDLPALAETGRWLAGAAGPRNRQQGRQGAGGDMNQKPPRRPLPPTDTGPGDAQRRWRPGTSPARPARPAEHPRRCCDSARAMRCAKPRTSAETGPQRYRALFDAVPDPVSIIDWDGTVLDLNKAGMAAYQRPREEIVGQPIDVLNPDLPRDHMDPVWEALNRGETYVIEVTNMRGDGTRFPVEVHSAGFEHEGERCIVAVARDLSGRREAELRYRELMETIDKGIARARRRRPHRPRQRRPRCASSASPRTAQPGRGAAPRRLADRRRARPASCREHELPPASVRCAPASIVEQHRARASTTARARQLTWLSVTSVPQFAAGQRQARTRCCRCSPTSPRSSATARCSTARRRWRTSAAGNGTPAATACT